MYPCAPQLRLVLDKPSERQSLPSKGMSLAALSLPDILTAGARDRIRRELLFQGFPTNRTVFLPHNSFPLFAYELSLDKVKLERTTARQQI